MPISSGKIVAPVSIDDVRTALGVSSYDLGYLCKNTHGKTNMWAKYKPVIYPSENINLTNSDWWKSSNGNCGIDTSGAQAGTYKDIVSKMTSDGANGYKYSPPQGGSNAPFRLLDFEGYMPEAMAPIHSFTVPKQVDNLSGGTFNATVAYNPSSSMGGSLSLSDIGGLVWQGVAYTLGDMYFGVYMVQKGGTRSQRLTADSPGTMQVQVPVGGLPVNTYNVYPFLSTVKLGILDTDKAAGYFTLPNTKVAEIQVVSTTYNIIINAGIGMIATALTVTVRVKNSTSSSKTFTNNWLWVRFAKYDLFDPLMSGETKLELGTFTVAAGETYTVIRKIFDIEADESYKVWVTLDSSRYTDSVAPLRPTA